MKATPCPIFFSPEGISQTHDGERILLNGIDLSVHKGQKISIVGPNGCGKSTLLSILAGALVPQEGTIQRAKGISVGYLQQEPSFPAGLTARQAVFTGDSPLARALRDYEEAVRRVETAGAPEGGGPGGGGLAQAQAALALERAMRQMDALEAWDAEARAHEMLGKLGCDGQDFLDTPVELLSGGQRKRLALAQMLVEEPDLLLMDEPTNHLSAEGVSWLTDRLGGRGVTLVMVRARPAIAIPRLVHSHVPGSI